MTAIADLALSPLLPWPWLAVLAGLAALPLLVAAFRRARGLSGRLLALAGLLLVLLNPSLIEEQRAPIDDVAVIVADRSPSQAIGERAAQREAALEALRAELEGWEGLDVRVLGSAAGSADVDETRLFESLDQALVDVPRSRMAGVVLLTDGQVHDAPADPAALGDLGPVHTLLTGDPSAGDRRLVVEQAPSYGLVGRTVELTVRVEDLPRQGTGGLAAIDIIRDGTAIGTMPVPIGRSVPLTLEITHGGPTAVELEVAPGEAELTLANNRAAVVVNGVRDRLRVLLVSGEPHPGERTWRSILKSDPSVDLVHFTILRPPESEDGTPIEELSLIAFPIRELFEVQLDDFDLVIFDRYRRRGVIHNTYLYNIAEYVAAGGAFLEASGPDFAEMFSLYNTPLGDVLPGAPTGTVFAEPFHPRLTELGGRHPVTAVLAHAGGEGASEGPPPWGRWFRQIEVRATGGDALMRGVRNRPLLLLERVGEGRVAQMMSDQIWLWSRGFEGGGPHAELLRRLAHWLMKEPELEEESLRAEAEGATIRVERRSLGTAEGTVAITSPTGETETLTLEQTREGVAVGRYTAGEPGLFRIADGDRTAIAVVGTVNPPEWQDVRTSGERLAPLAAASGGAVRWLADGVPALRPVDPGRDAAGDGWIGLRRNNDYTVTGAEETPLVPAWAAVALIVGGLLLAWRREGK
ncbi:MAG: hypothetical protein GVY13_00640 [Alphaproteobacteria bacterium]|jgi:hypothetical protein|nr:hypothetical protein [Alphaproteobacteria bacterium]